MANRHRSKDIYLKKANVDIKMIPIIKWLNSINNVFTTHCCEGDDEEGLEHQPYVVFWCLEFGVVLEIVKKIRCYGECSIFWPEDQQPFRYSLRFNDKEAMEHFLKDEL